MSWLPRPRCWVSGSTASMAISPMRRSASATFATTNPTTRSANSATHADASGSASVAYRCLLEGPPVVAVQQPIQLRPEHVLHRGEHRCPRAKRQRDNCMLVARSVRPQRERHVASASKAEHRPANMDLCSVAGSRCCAGQAQLRHYDVVIEQEPDAGMRLGEVMAVLTDLRQAGCRCWVAGGWGVDGLVGRQTRPHRDLDLAVDAEHEAAALGALSMLGYAVETDWRPVPEPALAPHRRWIAV